MSQRQFKTSDTSVWNDRFGNGGSGAYTVAADANFGDTIIDSACTGTADATSLSATNASFAANQIIFIHQTRGTGAGAWELNKISSYVAGTITTTYPLCNTYSSGAQVIVMLQYSGITINSGKTLTGKAWNGTTGGIIPLLSNGTATITGTISVAGGAGGSTQAGHGAGGTGGGFRGGQGLWGGYNTGTYCGEGTAGASVIQTGANGNGGGGSPTGDSSGTSGSGGGNGTAGAAGNSQGGDAVGLASLVTMDLGGGGGGGANDTGSEKIIGGGGAGGGIIFILSKTITVTGSLTVNGGAGGNGGGNPPNQAGAGGGGAGGSILLKGQTLTLGASLITASAGAAGSCGRNPAGAGGVGRIHADYSTSISGSTSPSIDVSVDRAFSDTNPYTRQFRSDDTSKWKERYGDGGDGVYNPGSVTDNPVNTTLTASIGQTSATFGSGTGFANGDLVLLHQTGYGGSGPGCWELNKIASGGGTTSVTLAYPTCWAYGTLAQVLKLKEYTSATISGTLTVKSWNGSTGGILGFFSLGLTTVSGTIFGGGAGFRCGPPVGPGYLGDQNTTGLCGEGDTQGSVGVNWASAGAVYTAGFQGTGRNDNGGGGGRGGDGGGGGGGGGYTTGSTGQGAPSEGGYGRGTSDLTNIMMGGGGGGGGTGNTGGGKVSGIGGSGAGIIFIFSKFLTVTGQITSNGVAGNSVNPSDAVGAGGGGGGGAILIKGQIITLGTNLLLALGGNGGSATNNRDGGTGGGGAIRVEYSSKITGTTNPTMSSVRDKTLGDPSMTGMYL